MIWCCRRCSVHGADPQHAPEWVLGFVINYRYIFFFRCSMMQKPEQIRNTTRSSLKPISGIYHVNSVQRSHSLELSSAQTTLMWVWLTDWPKQPAAKYGWNAAVPGVSVRSMLTNDSCGKRGIRGKGGEQTEPRSDWRESGVSKGASVCRYKTLCRNWIQTWALYKKINHTVSLTETQLLHSFNLMEKSRSSMSVYIYTVDMMVQRLEGLGFKSSFFQRPAC